MIIIRIADITCCFQNGDISIYTILFYSLINMYRRPTSIYVYLSKFLYQQPIKCNHAKSPFMGRYFELDLRHWNHMLKIYVDNFANTRWAHWVVVSAHSTRGEPPLLDTIISYQLSFTPIGISTGNWRKWLHAQLYNNISSMSLPWWILCLWCNLYN